MRKENQKRQDKKRFWTLFVLLSILLPYVQMMGSAFPKNVIAKTNENVLIHKPDVLEVSSDYQKQNDQVEWILHYEKKSQQKSAAISI